MREAMNPLTQRPPLETRRRSVLAQLILSAFCALAASGCATAWALSNLTNPQSDIETALLTHESGELGWKIWFGGVPLLEDQASGLFQWSQRGSCPDAHLMTIQGAQPVPITAKPPVRLADLGSGHLYQLPGNRVQFALTLPDDPCIFIVRLEQHQGPERRNIVAVYSRDGRRAETILLPSQPRGSLKQWVTLVIAPVIDPIVTPTFIVIMSYELYLHRDEDL